MAAKCYGCGNRASVDSYRRRGGVVWCYDCLREKGCRFEMMVNGNIKKREVVNEDGPRLPEDFDPVEDGGIDD